MIKKITSILLIILFTFATTFSYVPTAKADTLKDYKNKVAELEKKQDNTNRLTAEAEQKIKNKRNAILKANDTITENENKVESSKQLVASSQEKIKVKTSELKELIQVLQYTNISTDEVYVDYVFDSSSISEMIERQAVVEQVITYTQNQLDDLNKLIKDNEALQVQLAKDNVTLVNSISEYEKQVEDLQEEINELATVGLDYASQIEAQKGLIKIYEAAGCKDNDDIDDCYYAKINASGSFSRPLTKGRVTQPWKVNSKGKITHAGIDLGGVPAGTNIYAPASGTIVYVKYKYKCGGNIIYMHSVVDGKKYTVEFAHLKSIKVKIGDVVKKGQVIATQGGDSSTWYYDTCTSGTHLHYAISNGYYFTDATWNGFYTFQSNTKATSIQSISGFKNQKGWTWTTRG